MPAIDDVASILTGDFLVEVTVLLLGTSFPRHKKAAPLLWYVMEILLRSMMKPMRLALQSQKANSLLGQKNG